MHKIQFFCKKIIIVIICAFSAIHLSECFRNKYYRNILSENTAVQSTRQSKNFFPFIWVTFPPGPCGGFANSSDYGTCVPRGKCALYGGRANGACQRSFGECCQFSEMCTSNRTMITVNQTVTRLQSATSGSSGCAFRFRKEPNICQIRLDFASFESVKANDSGNCEVDRLKISGSITLNNNFVTCGKLTGQHMYLTFGSSDSIMVTPQIKSAAGRYDIRATKIACDSDKLAPAHCLQYFTTRDGRVESFDFGGQQQNNQSYTICVKPADDTTDMIKWTPCTGVTNPFDIYTSIAENPPCNDDYIEIRGNTRRCEWLSSGMPEIGNMRPFEVIVHFNEREYPDPPPSFTIQPDTCVSDTCKAASVVNVYTCDCQIGPPNACVCIYDLPVGGGGNPGSPPWGGDIDNVGFCLDYSQ